MWSTFIPPSPVSRSSFHGPRDLAAATSGAPGCAADPRQRPAGARRPRRAVPGLARTRSVLFRPGSVLDAFTAHWERHGDCNGAPLRSAFNRSSGWGRGAAGKGGVDRVPGVRLARRNPTARCLDSRWPVRRRVSICPTAAARGSATPASGELARVRVRDLRNGEVYVPGEAK